MSSDDRISPNPNHEETFNDHLTFAELLNTPQLARLYLLIPKLDMHNVSLKKSREHNHPGETTEHGSLTN